MTDVHDQRRAARDTRELRRGRIDRLFQSVVPILVVIVAGLCALHRLDDFDTWWHLAAGRWIIQHHSVPRTDVLSFALADRRWINMQWLLDVVLYGLHRLGGADLLVVSTALTLALTIAWLIRNLRPALGPVASSMLALWVTVIAQERFNVRPEVASFIFLQALLWLLTRARAADGRGLWLLPLISVLWTNSHHLSVIGLFTIGCYMGGAVAARFPLLPMRWREASAWSALGTRRVLIYGALAFLVTPLNPYFLDGALFPYKLMTFIDGSSPVYQTIGEFRRPFSDISLSPAIRAYRVFFVFSVVVVTLAGLATLVPRRRATRGSAATGRGGRVRVDAARAQIGPTDASRHRERFDLAGLALFVGLAYLSLLARRNAALFALAAAPFLGQCLRILIAHDPTPVRRIRARLATPLAVVATLATVGMMWLVVSNELYRRGRGVHEFGLGVLDVAFPIRACQFIREVRLPPRLYNDYSTGGYLTWDLPAGDQVYIDTLGSIFPDFFAAYLATLSDPVQWQREADRLGINTVLLFHELGSRHALIRALLADKRWALVYFDETSIVFVRAAGNEDLIERCNDHFTEWNQQILNELTSPVSSWQFPSGRAQALSAYAALLDILELPDLAAAFYSRLVRFNLPPDEKSDALARLAAHHADKGDFVAARAELARAAQADPNNQLVIELRKRIGN